MPCRKFKVGDRARFVDGRDDVYEKYWGREVEVVEDESDYGTVSIRAEVHNRPGSFFVESTEIERIELLLPEPVNNKE